MPAEPRATDAMVGVVLQDSYRLTRLIGKGGMGAVYEASHLRLAKRVAVKLMARELADDAEALARFRREAEVTSQLGHPHIVTVFDFGALPTGEPFLVMEYLDGEDLDHRLHRVGRLSLRSTLRIVRQIASALSATHAKQIVHRDLKPANVFLVDAAGETDFVKVVDFGISKMKGAGQKLTQTAALVGTPRFMSPEQAMGLADVDHRTDQFALGAIVYEMLSGKPAFQAETIFALVYQVVHAEPTPMGVFPEVEPVVRNALAKDPKARFPSVLEFVRALERAAGLTPVSDEWERASAVREANRSRPTAIAATVSADAAAAAAARAQAASTTLGGSSGQIAGRGVLRRSRWVLVAAGGVIAVTLVLAAVSRWSSRDSARSSAPGAKRPAAPIVTPVAPMAPPKAVRIDVVGAPPGTHLKVDGVPSAIPALLPRGPSTYRLLFEATGYESREIQVDGSSDRIITLTMNKLRASRSARPSWPAGARTSAEKASKPKVTPSSRDQRKLIIEEL